MVSLQCLQVINFKHTLHIPKEAQLSKEAGDLIQRLCSQEDYRLGCKGAQEIKQHNFFAHINFEGLRQTPAPYTPKIRFATDTSNFDPVDPEKLKHSGSLDSLKTLENGKHPEHAFFEFTFRRFFDDFGHPYAMKLTDPTTDSPVYV